MADAPESSAAAPMAAGFAPSSQKTASFLSLPIEIQKKIVAECSQSDLICLSLVSRHFRDLAAGQLYRNFHIVFPDEDDPAFDSPIDSLAGGLDTFVTAEYNYGQHLREISLDTLSSGPKSEKAYKPYLFGTSCGKFMNTLLLLTLKKSKSLEIFKWNIRVELSRSVYKALHQIHSLRKLQIRMQLGRSLYEALPPLPYTAPAALPSPSPPHSPHIASLPPIVVFNEVPPGINPNWGAAPAQGQGYPPPGQLPPPPPPPPSHGNLKMPHAKWKPGSGKPPPSPPARDPPTLSGFRDLQSLSVLDIDSLDLVDELRACITNSAPTLRKLRLSFSDSLAAQARKPPPDTESDDSDAEDEFQVVPAAQPASYDANGPAKTFRAQEERKKQEAVLTKVFNIDLFSAKRAGPAGPAGAQTKPSASSSSGQKPAGDDDKSKGKEKKEPAELDPEAEKQAEINAGSLYEGAIRSVAAKLAERCNGTTGMSNEEAQEMLNIIVTASKIYVGSRSGGGDKVEDQAPGPDGPLSPSAGSDAGGSAVAEPSASPEPSAFSSGSKPNRSAGDKSEHADLGINMEVPDSDEDDGFETVDDDEEDGDEEGQGPVEVVNLDEVKNGDQGGGKKSAEGQEEKKPSPAGKDADHVASAQDTAGGAGGAAAAAESAQPGSSEPPPPSAPPTAAAARVEKVNLARLVARAQKVQGQADRLSGKIQKAIDSDQPLTEQEVRDAAREVHNLYASVAVLSDDIILAEAKCTKGKAAAAQAVPDRKGKAPATDPDTTAGPADTTAAPDTTTTSALPTPAITERTDTSPTAAAASASTAAATTAAAAKDEARAMREYVVSTHGIALQSLCIHLIPIRTSVLTRALDLHVLEKVTLLNVGNQIPFWAQMFKENKLKALPLRRIFTDHVTPTFLQCVSQLDRVDELLLLERSAKYKPESFAPKVPTTIDQIRRLALNKHMPTLKRLMIKDASAQPSWDVNVKTMLMICLRGVKLEELAVSMNIAAVHTFMQHMKGLISLRALHIIHFRNSDTCVWVMRETLKFIVDNLAHHPNLKLEWIAIEDDRVDRIMRPTDSDDDPSDDCCKSKKKDRKGKKKAAAAAAMSAAAAATAALGSSSSSGPAGGGDMPELPADGWDYSDSGSDDDDYDPEAKLKLKTMTGVQFYDVWGVKLFSKEVRAGRL